MVRKRDLCIVHIGMPKTGSSALQESFFNNLKDERVSYGNLPEANQSGRLYGLFVDKPQEYHYFTKKNWNNKEIEKFRNENIKLLVDGFVNHETPIELLSAEDLFHLGSQGSIEALKNFLEPYFKKIIVVAYVRPIKSFMESAFQQLVKNHYLGNFDFNRIYHRYKNFQAYDEVFGEKNVLLWKFDPINFPDGDIVLDFSEKLQLKPTKAKKKIVNKSLSLEAIAILFTYHFHKGVKSDFGKKLHFKNNALIEKISTIGNTKFKFSKKLIQKIVAQHEEDYKWINNRMQDSLTEVLNESDNLGVSTETELMWIATEQIDQLVEMLGKENIRFELKKHPQTVAKLVDLLMMRV